MASITYWNRVEPSPRSDSLVRGLEARVRDPLWMLTRQWQFGEFRAEDAASPAFVSFAATFSEFESWRSGDGPFTPFDGTAPLEALVGTEAATPDWRTAVELGQALERRLRDAGVTAAGVTAFRTAFPVPRPADLGADEAHDTALVHFLRVCGGRATDGGAALTAATASAPAVPPQVSLPAGEDIGAVETVLAASVAWAADAYGQMGRTDAAAWRPDRLDYDVEVQAATPTGGRDRLRAHAGLHGDFDWHGFDVVERERAQPPTASTPIATSLFPTPVSFAGMPNSRWWQFEDARFNWAALDADRRELAKTLVIDFMLVQGNDWFLVPFGQRVGSLMRVDQLLVRDVFGELTLVRRADADGRWSMFSTSVADDGLADYFLLPPSSLRATMDGPVVEEVHFVRDEQANMVWAVEETTEDGIGRPWNGRERALAAPDEPPPPPPADVPLRYRLQTTVPVNWIPFMPVQIDAARRAVALQRAAMQRFADGVLTTNAPVGRVLTPTNLADPAIYRVNEEEVERSGTRILRAVRRTRWTDGSTHVWVSRRRRVGSGEAASGLRFDLAERTNSGS
ncbi:hypothetical protein [Streptomyces canus]|uniref:hypothetical protein n=1 Tax=Streptomyces canus TaxID=58343 RepID=UPI002E2ED95C|nr:hypothetical protein [Streptomyces canus]